MISPIVKNIYTHIIYNVCIHIRKKNQVNSCQNVNTLTSYPYLDDFCFSISNFCVFHVLYRDRKCFYYEEKQSTI